MPGFFDLAGNTLAAPEFGPFTTATGCGGTTNQCPGVNGDGFYRAHGN